MSSCECDWRVTLGGAAGVALLLYGIRTYTEGRQYRGKERLDGKVVIVTGSNTGIGKAHATDLARRGAKVYLACRSKERGEEAKQEIEKKTGSKLLIFSQLDLGSQESIRAFVKRFLAAETRLDILVNNAAVITYDRETSVDGYEMQLAVNHLGPFLLTNLLLDILKKTAPSRVVTVSSAGHYMGSIDREDLNTERKPYSQFSNYAQTKLANVLFTRSLSQRLYGTGVTTNSLHPGAVHSELGRNLTWLNIIMLPLKPFFRTAASGAQTQIRLSVDPALEKVTGKYFDNCREVIPAAYALDDELGEWLWRKSEELTGLKTTKVQ